VLTHANRIYLLDAEIRTEDSFISQRPSVPHIHHADVWMVIRVQTLRWSPTIYTRVLKDLARWYEAGNRMAGIQIDFDARTRHLEDYAAFLKDLRRSLPSGCQLSITGLLDWSANGDPRGLDALAGVVDEVVLQIYQGKRVIAGYETYLARLDRLKIPFRIGLLQYGEWHEPAKLATNPWFRGYVVFLQNPEAAETDAAGQ